MLTIRSEQPSDRGAIWLINRTAFGSSVEPDLVDALRAGRHVILSLVAEEDGLVVGHVVFSPLTIESDTASWDAVCLGPIAVSPSRQSQGIGGKLIEAALAALRQGGYRAVVLLGHPGYYPRFGFRPAREFGLHYQDDRDAFMAIELYPGGLDGVSGRVRFSPEFDEIH